MEKLVPHKMCLILPIMKCYSESLLLIISSFFLEITITLRDQVYLFKDINVIQDGPFRGCSRMGDGQKGLPP